MPNQNGLYLLSDIVGVGEPTLKNKHYSYPGPYLNQLLYIEDRDRIEQNVVDILNSISGDSIDMKSFLE